MGSPMSPRDPTSAFDSPTFNLNMSIRVEQPVSSASISPSGRDVVLASRLGLHIIDLDNPYDPPRFLQHRTAWEVADVQWSPFAARDYWVVSTSNQKAMVWNLAMPSRRAIEHVLHAHTRAITDINFSAHHPDLLATCSVDSFVHCWDLRDPRRPAISFCDWFAGATQVKYNRQNEHILASSHDKYLRIWDDRKGVYPLRSINAHTTKIYGIDWNRTRPTGIVTCALDKSIRFWDYAKPEEEPERIIRMHCPVWRARHTPFGWGLMVMPQRGDNSLYLYDRRAKGDAHADPAARFDGHSGPVKEFLWRPRGGMNLERDDREFQLVSWAQDNDIRLWTIDNDIMLKTGHDPEAKVRFRITRRGAPYKTFRNEQKLGKATAGDGMTVGKRLAFGPRSLGESLLSRQVHVGGIPGRRTFSIIGPTRGRSKGENPIAWMTGIKINKLGSWEYPDHLGEEISLVGAKFPKVEFEKVNVNGRTCTISLKGPWGSESKWVFLRAEVTFPIGYPETASPEFRIEKTTAISETSLETLHNKLRKIGECHLARKKMCLETCVCFLLGECGEDVTWNPSEAEQDDSTDEEDLNAGPSEVKDLITKNNQASVPLPKECGATFSRDGRLVCFFPPKEDQPFALAGFWSQREHQGRSGKFFESFGRLYTSPQVPKGLRSSTGGASSAESDFETSSSDSDDSDEDMLRPSLAWRFHGSHAGAGIGRRGKRTGGSTDRSTQRSITGGLRNSSIFPQSGYGSNSNNRRNIVKLINISSLIPSKKELAEEYMIYGEKSEVCQYNHEVALKYGYQDLADVWKLAGWIVAREVPLEIMHQPWGTDPILVVAKQATTGGKRRDSGIGDEDIASDEAIFVPDLNSEDEPQSPLFPTDPRLKGRIKWGGHPFGGSWLVNKLFSYFEQKADVQMLGMLACIFCEAETRPEDATPWLNINNSDEFLLAAKGPAYSLDYYASYRAVLDAYPSPSVSPQNNSVAMTPVFAHGSYSSSNGFLGGSDGFNAYSTGNTPPTSSTYLSRPFGESAGISGHQSLSSSPEFTHHQAHPIRRSTSSIVNFGFTRAFNSGNASPPTRRPVESLANFATSTGMITWGQNTIFGSGSRDAASSIATDEDDEDLPPAEINIRFLNRDEFDDEGFIDKPLLDPRKSKLYRAYRDKYADLLFIWDLKVQRLEVLKFNGVKSTADKEEDDLALGKKLRDRSGSWSGLDIRGTCTKCGQILDVLPQKVGGPKGECKSCKRKQATMICSVCNMAIKGLYGACLICGHVAHSKCHKEWFHLEIDDPNEGRPRSLASLGLEVGAQKWDTQTECPAGCGCWCMEHSKEGFGFIATPQAATGATPSGPSTNRSKPKPRFSRAIDVTTRASGEYSSTGFSGLALDFVAKGLREMGIRNFGDVDDRFEDRDTENEVLSPNTGDGTFSKIS